MLVRKVWWSCKFSILGFPWSWELPDQEYIIQKKCLSVRPSVTRCGAETTGPILILKSGDGVEKLGDGAESILVPLTLTTRRLEPENLEKTRKKFLFENLSIDFD